MRPWARAEKAPTSAFAWEYKGDSQAEATVGTKQAVHVSKEFQSGSQSRGGGAWPSLSIPLGTGPTSNNALGPLKDEDLEKSWDSGDYEEITHLYFIYKFLAKRLTSSHSTPVLFAQLC